MAPIWQGNIIQQGGKVMTQQTPVKGAVAAVRKEIGLEPVVDAEPAAAA